MEKCFLAALKLPNIKPLQLHHSIEELRSLANSAGAITDDVFIQSKSKIDPAYYFGIGKAIEISELAQEKEINTLIIDDEIKPSQQRNLQDLTKLKIVDRTRLILDIFAKRAQSKEGKLQVERAQLAYNLTHLACNGVFLDSQKGGIGTRGPGEKKLETDQRKIKNQITALDKELLEIKRHRDTSGKERINSGTPLIAIVGYTNAGKSTLLNTIAKTKNPVYADNRLFATLDTATRSVAISEGRKALFTDTVGFINKLPHQLIAAFHSTLSGLSRAHCLLHIIDTSNDNYIQQKNTVYEVLKEVGSGEVPVIEVYNKIDSVPAIRLAKIKKETNECFFISAKNGKGIDELLNGISNLVMPKLQKKIFNIPFGKESVVAQIRSIALIDAQKYSQKGLRVNLRATPAIINKISHLLEN